MKKKKFKKKGYCVLRGGSWGYSPMPSSSARTIALGASLTLGYLIQGFRCVSPVDSPAIQRFVRIK